MLPPGTWCQHKPKASAVNRATDFKVVALSSIFRLEVDKQRTEISGPESP